MSKNWLVMGTINYNDGCMFKEVTIDHLDHSSLNQDMKFQYLELTASQRKQFQFEVGSQGNLQQTFRSAESQHDVVIAMIGELGSRSVSAMPKSSKSFPEVLRNSLSSRG